jgi:hypothetical protein
MSWDCLLRMEVIKIIDSIYYYNISRLVKKEFIMV